MHHAADLAHQRFLVLEDDWLTAADITHALRSSGAHVIGPMATATAALEVIEKGAALDAALLDLNLEGGNAFPVVEALMARGVPILLATGYGENVIPSAFRNLPRCQKPFQPEDIVRSLGVLRQGRPGPGDEEQGKNKLLAELGGATRRKLAPFLELVDVPKRRR
mgnify:CR=1 FL=1